MEDFLNVQTSIEQTYWYIALIGSVTFALIFILTFIGGGDADMESDLNTVNGGDDGGVGFQELVSLYFHVELIGSRPPVMDGDFLHFIIPCLRVGAAATANADLGNRGFAGRDGELKKTLNGTVLNLCFGHEFAPLNANNPDTI